MKRGLATALLLGLSLCSLGSLVYAAQAASMQASEKLNKNFLLRPAIQLDKIEPLKVVEKVGDEIYVGITEFNSNGKNSYYTIPQSPVYWPSESLTQIHSLQVWQGKLIDAQSTEVIISLIEQDTPPWDLDDLIGVVKVKMINQAGKLSYQWYQDGQLLKQNKSSIKVILHGSAGLYKAELSLFLRDSTKAQASPDAVKDKK